MTRALADLATEAAPATGSLISLQYAFVGISVRNMLWKPLLGLYARR